MGKTEHIDYGSLLRQAYGSIEQLEARITQLERAKAEPIAIVGIGCRIPGGVNNPAAYWEILRNGMDEVTEVPPDRWDAASYFSTDPDAVGMMSTRWGGFLDNVAQFDAPFFGISPREATSMDPQQRLLLEVSWEALEHAGIAPDSLMGSQTGVFVGISTSDYSEIQTKSGDPEVYNTYLATGNSHSVASGRLAYFLGLQGPTFSIDTACSSSLIAVHVACQSLRSGSCQAALACGVNLVLIPEATVTLSKAQMMASDGHCKTFSDDADGFVRGEGCGVIVLKRLSDATANSDRILAVIRGGAINQDGRSNGLTAPNGLAQASLIRNALADARVKPTDVSYVEAHGTGTPLGDPIEIHAIAAALSEGRTPDNRLLVGSAKTNIGHLEAASGIAGLIKVVLALQAQQIPPHLHLRQLSRQIAWSEIPIDIPTVLTAWNPPSGRRIAGVSSFGFSGSNAHIILEQAPPFHRVTDSVERPSHLLVLSARTGPALENLVSRCAQHLQHCDSDSLADVCFTFGAGRAHFSHRIALVVNSIEQAREKLDRAIATESGAGIVRGVNRHSEVPEIAMFFTGEESAYPGMARALRMGSPTFRKAFDLCVEAFAPHVDRSFISLVSEGAECSNQDPAAHAALFAVEYALAELWRSWGIEPSLVLGLGVGEYVAACVAGVMSLTDAAGLVVARSRLLSAPPGSQSAQPFLERFTQMAGAVHYDRPRLPWFSASTGGIVTGTIHANHWIQQTRNMGSFLDAAETLRARAIELAVEVGPSGVLVGLAREAGVARPAWVASLQKGKDDWQEMLTALGTLYVNGSKVDWGGLDKDYARRPVALPTYPFQRQRYWYDASPRAGQGQDHKTPVLREGIADWFYEERWEPKPLDVAADSADCGIRPDGPWLIIALDQGRGERLRQSLSARGCRVILATPGVAWSRDAMDRITFNPERADDYSRVLREALFDGSGGGLVVIASATTTDASIPFDAIACRSLVQLAQAIGDMPDNGPRRAWIVTSGAQEGTSAAPQSPLVQAPLIGLARSLALEQPALGWVRIDLASQDDTPMDAVVDELIACKDESEVGFHQGSRLVRRLVRNPAPENTVPAAHIRPDGTYLVSGGFGALGLIVARWLVSRGARNLILVGRSGAGEKGAAAVAEFERQGVCVRTARASVADEGQMRTLLAETAQAMPPLAGVIHAAGVLDDGLIGELSWPRFERVFLSKLHGAWNLHLLTQKLQLDFFVLFSSAASFFGSAGQANYSSANSFLDALARHRHQLCLPALSINWGPWEGEGMAADVGQAHRRRWHRWGSGAISAGAGMDALERALKQPNPQIAVVPIDWAGLQPEAISPSLRNFVGFFLPQADPSSSHGVKTGLRAALLELPTQEREPCILAYLSETVAGIIGMPHDAIEPDQGLAELGFDSLMGLELKNRLELDVDFKISTAQLLNNPTIRQLACRIGEVIVPMAAPPISIQQRQLATATPEMEEGEL